MPVYEKGLSKMTVDRKTCFPWTGENPMNLIGLCVIYKEEFCLTKYFRQTAPQKLYFRKRENPHMKIILITIQILEIVPTNFASYSNSTAYGMIEREGGSRTPTSIV